MVPPWEGVLLVELVRLLGLVRLSEEVPLRLRPLTGASPAAGIPGALSIARLFAPLPFDFTPLSSGGPGALSGGLPKANPFPPLFDIADTMASQRPQVPGQA